MKIKTDQSYGIIPIRKVGGEWEVFLINQFSKIKDNTYWVFPKGHPEKDETPEDTAARELLEETGMTAQKILSAPRFTLKYSFMFNGVKIQKTVDFFIGIIAMNCPIKLDVSEVKEAGWFTLDAAATQLDYQDTKQVFNSVRSFLDTYEPNA